jgi:hypothetical protein
MVIPVSGIGGMIRGGISIFLLLTLWKGIKQINIGTLLLYNNAINLTKNAGGDFRFFSSSSTAYFHGLSQSLYGSKLELLCS